MNHHPAHSEPDPALDRALASLRDRLGQAPDEVTASRHLAAMRTAAGEAPGGWWARLRERSTLRRNPMPGLTPRWLAVSTATVLGFTGGLAAADVLPDPAQNVVAEMVSKVGIDLPDPDDVEGDGVEGAGEHGTDDNPSNDHGKTVSSVAHDDSLSGCEKGQAVSAVASSKSQGRGEGPPEGHDPCAQGDDGVESEDDGDDDGIESDDDGIESESDEAPGKSGSARGRGRGSPSSSPGVDDDSPGSPGGDPGHGPGDDGD